MKSILYFVVSIIIAITLTSAVQNAADSNKIITLQSADKNVGSELLKHSADIISSRLKLYGLSSFDVKISAEKGQIKIKVADSTEISAIEGLVTSKGELAFYETYTQSEIKDLLKQDNPLFKFLKFDKEPKSYDPRVGCTDPENKKDADEYLSTAKPVQYCKLLWHFEPEKSRYCLFALKTKEDGKPLLVRSDVDSVRIATTRDTQEPKIQIRLKPAAAIVFADATKRDLKKAIAIVIDDRVYSWPVVQAVIEGGQIEVTGDFTEKEVKYFPALFNSDQLPLTFKMLK
jgi:preprotein translocase subunit SecD